MSISHTGSRAGWVAMSTLLFCTVWAATSLAGDSEPAATDSARAGEVARWSMRRANEQRIANEAGSTDPAAALEGRVVGQASFVEGLTDVDGDESIKLLGDGGRIVVADPGANSPLDFGLGDTVTLEAWVNLTEIADEQNIYVVGKGRTYQPGFMRNNQNYALRLRGQGDEARISFLFRSAPDTADSAVDDETNYHRWTSETGFPAGTGWHHIAVSFRFGDAKSMRGYIDGVRVEGAWDLGGPTDAAPMVDNDELWIGSSMGGSKWASFVGRLDEVAISRKPIDAKKLAARWQALRPKTPLNEQAGDPPPSDTVRVQIIEGGAWKRWPTGQGRVTDEFNRPSFALSRVTNKYDEKALISDRSESFIVRVSSMIELEPGAHRILLRGLNATRLKIDGRPLGSTRFLSKGGDGHEVVPDQTAAPAPGMRPMPPGHAEKLVTFHSAGGTHAIEVEAFVGGPSLRPEVGELALAIEGSDGTFRLVSPTSESMTPLTDADWLDLVDAEQETLRNLNSERRRLAGEGERDYWNQRHELARRELEQIDGPTVPKVGDKAVHNAIDRFINVKLAEHKVEPAGLVDDVAFLRRASLDVIGIVPTPDMIEAYLADAPDQRRVRLIDRLLDDPRWADHWVGYWQDVLAENPGILRPTLNNTGPFRWWIYESFLDNKPIDRFATELIAMQGSAWYGGPAGFAMATENDVPMAAKAHIIGRAFLGVEMQCARCHDAPFQDVDQRDLFATAAMLKRSPQHVPASSSIPGSKERIARMIVEVTLEPGSDVAPAWAFDKLLDREASQIPAMLMRPASDTRQQLAARVTWWHNPRFAQVMVNRLWQRYLGAGIVEPIDDWDMGKPSHPELLEYLGRELVTSGYDLKHVTKMILLSHTYQRRVDPDKCGPLEKNTYLFASPLRRRMDAEQVVDSLFTVADKRFHAEQMNIDIQMRRPVHMQQNLGVPTRAWQFASLSNERDRPSLAMPYAQAIIDVLSTFGWRESRQNPLSVRDTIPTVQQPAMLSNGVVMRRIASLSDDSAFTEMALTAKSPEALVDGLYRRVLTREPTKAERAMFVELLTPGFVDRVNHGVEPRRDTGPRMINVSWSNHVNPEATRLKNEAEKLANAGDPPTQRLKPDWRARAEDVVWALLNSPEFIYLP